MQQEWEARCNHIWKQSYAGLSRAPVQEKLRLMKLQKESLEVNSDEAHVEEAAAPAQSSRDGSPAVFSEGGVYATPSAFISELIAGLP